MIIDLDSWEMGYADGLNGHPSRPQADFTRSPIRAATFRVERRIRTILNRQEGRPLNPVVLTLGCSFFFVNCVRPFFDG